MKKLRALCNRNKAAVLLPGCYATGLVVLLALHLAGFAANRLAYANGTLAPATLTVADFELVGLVELLAEETSAAGAGNALVSIDGDPQLVLRDTALRVENVTFDATYGQPPLGEAAYWAAPGQDYSVRRMAYPTGGAGAARFLLPAAGGQGLRIDPGSVAGNRITINSITINNKRPFIGFFIPTTSEVVLLCVLPGLLACGLSILLGLVHPSAQAVGGVSGSAAETVDAAEKGADAPARGPAQDGATAAAPPPIEAEGGDAE